MKSAGHRTKDKIVDITVTASSNALNEIGGGRIV